MLIFIYAMFVGYVNIDIMWVWIRILEIQELGWTLKSFLRFFFFYCFYIYSYVYTLFGPSLPPASGPLTSRQNLFCPLVIQFCFRKNIRDNKKDIAFLLVWDKDSYTDRLLVLLPCTCVLQPKLIYLYQTSSLLPVHLPIMASASLRLLY
jgi:hypothetical protein